MTTKLNPKSESLADEIREAPFDRMKVIVDSNTVSDVERISEVQYRSSKPSKWERRMQVQTFRLRALELAAQRSYSAEPEDVLTLADTYYEWIVGDLV